MGESVAHSDGHHKNCAPCHIPKFRKSVTLISKSGRVALHFSRRTFLRQMGASGAAISFCCHADLLNGARRFDGMVSQAKLAADPLRPQFHLLPTRNWMNDPNGPIYWKGQYHMFFQYNPNAAVWGDMHWDHAISPDMVRWKHLPVALAPTPGGADKDGCFTGSMVDDKGVPTILYTGVNPEVQCLATSRDPLLRSWDKVAKAVIPTPPTGMQVVGFRDPCPWREGDWWYMGIGSGIKKKGGMVLLYRSKDLRDWEYLHP